MVTWDKAGERRAGVDTVQKSKKKVFRVMDMFTALIMLMISWVHT